MLRDGLVMLCAVMFIGLLYRESVNRTALLVSGGALAAALLWRVLG